MELKGWKIFISQLEIKEKAFLEEKFILETIKNLKLEFEKKEISKDETVIKIRKLFHQAGCDPTKYRPSFEALARRILRGEEFPKINPQVDFCNCLSLKWHVPCCICDLLKIEFPLNFRKGRENETFESLRGPFSLKNKPLIEDKISPFSTPITDSIRTKVDFDTKELLFISYFPEDNDFEKIKKDFFNALSNTSFNFIKILNP